jgi:hypothetical protein
MTPSGRHNSSGPLPLPGACSVDTTCLFVLWHVDTLGIFLMIRQGPGGARGLAMMRYSIQTETRMICADSDDHEP